MPPIIMDNIAEEAAKLLDFNQKLDISLLDDIVECMYLGKGPEVRLIYLAKFTQLYHCYIHFSSFSPP